MSTPSKTRQSSNRTLLISSPKNAFAPVKQKSVATDLSKNINKINNNRELKDLILFEIFKKSDTLSLDRSNFEESFKGKNQLFVNLFKVLVDHQDPKENNFLLLEKVKNSLEFKIFTEFPDISFNKDEESVPVKYKPQFQITTRIQEELVSGAILNILKRAQNPTLKREQNTLLKASGYSTTPPDTPPYTPPYTPITFKAAEDKRKREAAELNPNPSLEPLIISTNSHQPRSVCSASDAHVSTIHSASVLTNQPPPTRLSEILNGSNDGSGLKAAEDAKGPRERFYDALKKHSNKHPGVNILSPSGVSLKDLKAIGIDPESLRGSLSLTANSPIKSGR